MVVVRDKGDRLGQVPRGHLGSDATPTSQIAERAAVPKQLRHYYALAARFRWMVEEIRAVMGTARHAGEGLELQPLVAMHRELDFFAEVLTFGVGGAY